LLFRQTQLARELENERRRGGREAARSWLSLHLSTIIRYARSTGEGVWELIQQCDDNILPGSAKLPDFPALPMEAAVAVKEFAGFADEQEAKFVALLFATMQVLNARIEGFVAKPGGAHVTNLEDYLEDAAE